MTKFWAWLCAALGGVVASLGALLWFSKRAGAKKAREADERAATLARERIAQASRDAEATAAAQVAAVDAEAQRKIEEAAHGGAAALRDRVNNRS